MARNARPAQRSSEPSADCRLTESVIIVDLHFQTGTQATVLVPESIAELRPSYDARHRELWFLDLLVKRFRHPAKNQERVLLAFQEQDWLGETDDPLAPSGETLSSKRLSDTIAALNSHHENAGLITFVTRGQRIGWMPGNAAHSIARARRAVRDVHRMLLMHPARCASLRGGGACANG